MLFWAIKIALLPLTMNQCKLSIWSFALCFFFLCTRYFHGSMIVFSPPLVPGGFADTLSELHPHWDLLFTEVAQFICVFIADMTFLIGWFM